MSRSPWSGSPYFLIDAALLFATCRVSGLAFPVGFAAAIWALISPYYYGNLLLYDNFAMVSSLALGAVTFAALARGLEPSRGMFALLAIAGVGASLSNPFCGVATFIATGALFFAPQIPKSFVIKLWLTIGGVLAIFLCYLAATGSLGAFYADVFIFNTTTYQKYSPLPFVPAISTQLLLFDLFNPVWLRSLDPLRFIPNTGNPVFDHWIFSGLFYRVAAVLVCLLLALRRNYKAALFLYIFIALLPLRKDESIHAAPFVLFCLFMAGLGLEEAASLSLPWKVVVLPLCAVPALLLGWSGVRYMRQHAFQSDFAVLHSAAQVIREAAKNRPDVRLGNYPAGDYMYYLTGYLPPSKFVYFYPWVADVGRSQMDHDLARESNVLLILDISGDIWSYPNATTFASEIAYAGKHLVREKFGYMTAFVSPSLAIPANLAPAYGASAFRPGVYRKGEWLLGAGTDEVLVPTSKTCHFGGQPDDVPVTGDWNGSGRTKIGVYRASKGDWLLDYNGNGELDAADKTCHFAGRPGDIPVTGDWSGDGKTKIGFYRPSTGEWLLDYDGNGTFDPAHDKTYKFGGAPGDRPIVGDWTGSKVSRAGVVHKDYRWEREGVTELFSMGGIPGDVPIVGDWNGDGRTKAGILRQGDFWILDVNGNHILDVGAGKDVTFPFGRKGDVPVTGAW